MSQKLDNYEIVVSCRKNGILVLNQLTCVNYSDSTPIEVVYKAAQKAKQLEQEIQKSELIHAAMNI